MRRLLAASLLALALPALALAENSTLVGGYTIHHNAMTTDTLTPQIAQAYDIKRSANRGMISISVLENRPDGQPRAVSADIDVVAANLTGQTRDIDVRRIQEGNAIYYIADFPVSHEETLNFVLEVEPEGVEQPYTARFSQKFYTR
jgi:hypothetical protein